MQVGTPGQSLRLLPGTSASAGSTIWVVVDEGCTIANPNLSNCGDERGDLFHRNLSTSWSTDRLEGQGIYSLNTLEESQLGLEGNAYYGWDTVMLGLPGSNMPSVRNQTIAGLGTNDFWLGSLGLSAVPFNFTNLNDPQPSLLGTLYNQSIVPSLSWAYSAGAQYQDTFGSLTLGGYDTTRFKPNNVSFAFGADFSRDLVVTLQSITYNSLGSSPLLASSIDIFIDSLVTQLWLPVSVCQAFEQAFGLTWNATSQLYLIDDDTHNKLLQQNPTFTFTIANGTGSTVEIAFPYAAFDLNITQPLVNSSSRYFPLKQAQNSTQYTLGRVFLQEAYVIADYARQNFTVAQALFPPSGMPQNLVAIRAPGDEAVNQVNPSGDGGISGGAIGGIVVGVIVLLALIAGYFLWARRRKQRKSKAELPANQAEPTVAEKTEPGAGDQEQRHMPELESGPQMRQEIDGYERMKVELEGEDSKFGRQELGAPVKVHEVESPLATPAHELESPPAVHEMPSPGFGGAVELEAPLK